MIQVILTSSVLIVVIALLRLVLKGRIRPGLQYGLWGLVLLRLLVPVSWFESPVSVAEAAAPALEQVEEISGYSVSAVQYYFAPAETNITPDPASPSGPSLRDICLWVWLGGTGLLAAWFLGVNLRLGKTLSRERRLYSNRYAVPVYVIQHLPSPCLFSGAIYLTEDAASDPLRAEYIIAHELTHRRHGDGLWSALRVICLAVYWFHPLVWLAAALSRRDCEIFCDAATVNALGEEHRFEYGRTLLDMTAVQVRPADLVCSATTMSGSGRSLKERIGRIVRKQKHSLLLCAAAVLIAAVAVGCTFSGAKTEMFFEEDPVILSEEYTPAPEATPTPPPLPADPLPEGVYYGTAAAANRQDPDWNALMETEFFELYTQFMGAMGTTWENASQYVYGLSEEASLQYGETFSPYRYASMKAFQSINDDLMAFLNTVQTQASDTTSEPYEVLHFVGRVDGQMWVFLSEEDIPEALRDGLDRLYFAANELVPGPGDTVILDEEGNIIAIQSYEVLEATPSPIPDRLPPVATSSVITYNGDEIFDFTERVGQSIQLSVLVYPSNAEFAITWSSSDESVATVSQDGLVTITGAGQCTIFATTDDGLRTSCICRGMS